MASESDGSLKILKSVNYEDNLNDVEWSVIEDDEYLSQQDYVKKTIVDDEKPAIKRDISLTSSESESEDEEENSFQQDMTDYKDVTISFMRIFQQNIDITEYFLPCVPVRATIKERIYQPASHRMNPTLYVVSISHGPFRWIIKRRDNHFRDFYRHLEVYHARLIVQHPTLATRIEKIPKFPHRPEITKVKQSSKDKHMRKLQRFLQHVINIDRYRNCKYTLDFLEVCSISFVQGLGQKEKEIEVSKRSGGHTFSRGILGALKFHGAWHKRWLVVKGSFVTYLDKENNLIRDVLLFDNGFNVTCDSNATGIRNGLLISNNSRNLLVKCSSGRQARELMHVLVNTMSRKGSDWVREHRYNSFAPVRRQSWVKWYIDGSGYFAEVARAITMAKEEIFITDWWLSPELMLQRPAEHIDKSRLDLLLQERAQNGVKIFVLLYKELEMTLSINSYYSKKTLLSLHSENIKVIRHPDHVVGNTTLLWAHHEKLVCIDQKICFLGGLDLCYGRWDNETHCLTDFGSATPSFFGKTESAVIGLAGLVVNNDAINSAYHKQQLQNLTQAKGKTFIGKDYTNPYLQDIADVDKPFVDQINRLEVPRMPWHDIGCMVVGNTARDVARHFIQRWNYHKHTKAKELSTVPFLLPKTFMNHGKVPVTFDHLSECDVQILRSSSSWSTGESCTELSIQEAYREHIRNSKYFLYIENQFFITSLQDHSVLNGIGDSIVQRILMAFNNDETFRVIIVMPLLPCFPGEIGTPAATSTMFVEYWNLMSSRAIIAKLRKNGIDDPSQYISFYGLRQYADLHGKMVSEIVYVHSKMMIVDDLVTIIGSANINDRSMLGSRDSELAVCVQDIKYIDGVMNGKKVQVGQFSSRLRRKLFQEHLGMLNEPYHNVIDPISDDFYQGAWMAIAKSNTDIYEQVFKCLPTNEVKSFFELERYKKTAGLNVSDPVQARLLLKNIRGHLVLKPLDFLLNENLWPSADSKEYLVPIKVFT